MEGLTNLSWEIVVSPSQTDMEHPTIDWLVISPLTGTGNTKISVSIIDGLNTDTAATVTLWCTSCPSQTYKTFQIERCNPCDCYHLELNKEKPYCNCGALSVNPLSLTFEPDGSTQSFTVSINTENCDIREGYTYFVDWEESEYIKSVEQDKTDLDTWKVTMEENTGEPRTDKIYIKYGRDEHNNELCDKLTINLTQKECCDCKKLILI